MEAVGLMIVWGMIIYTFCLLICWGIFYIDARKHNKHTVGDIFEFVKSQWEEIYYMTFLPFLDVLAVIILIAYVIFESFGGINKYFVKGLGVYIYRRLYRWKQRLWLKIRGKKIA